MTQIPPEDPLGWNAIYALLSTVCPRLTHAATLGIFAVEVKISVVQH